MIKQHVHRQLRYKSWANRQVFRSLVDVPHEEIVKSRKTLFKNIVRTLDHVYVVDDIFKAHLTGESHAYTSRSSTCTPELGELSIAQTNMDSWLIEYQQSLDDADLLQQVEFSFVNGGKGKMSRADILQHLVNHNTYHRGFLSDMMYQIPSKPIANDYSVFIRDALNEPLSEN